MISDCTPNLSGVIDREAPYSAVNRLYDVMFLKSNRARSKHQVSGPIGNRFDWTSVIVACCFETRNLCVCEWKKSGER